MKHNLESKTRIQLLTITLTAIFALQLIVTPVSAATVYAWDFSGSRGFYNADTQSLQSSRPTASESGGTIWTTNLQELAANTSLVPIAGGYKICILLPTTGGLGLIGVDEIRGADIAVDQANAILAAGTTGLNFTDDNRADSATNPTAADNGFRNLVDVQGCQIVVGAAGSGEVSGFKASADLREVPAISPSSTAASLAISGDYIYRAPGNDLVQAPAIAAWLYSQGIRHAAVITRQDPYGTGLRDGFEAEFLALSGTTIADTDATTYDPSSISAAQSATNTLNTQVGSLLSSNPANTVGVLQISFEDDGFAILDRARTLTNLPLIRWFGVDGTGGTNALIPPPTGTGSEAVAAFMATTVNYTGTFPTNPTLGAGGTDMYTLAREGEIVPKVGGGTIDLSGTGWDDVYSPDPQPYWDYAYDSAVLAMLAVLKAGVYDGTSIAPMIGLGGNATIGATGLLSLSSPGDRLIQHYIIYGYTATEEVPALANAYVALTLIFLAATATLTVARKRRL